MKKTTEKITTVEIGPVEFAQIIKDAAKIPNGQLVELIFSGISNKVTAKILSVDTGD